MAKVMSKEARHMQRQDRASRVPLEILEHQPPKYVPFIIGNWNAEVGSQETPGVTG